MGYKKKTKIAIIAIIISAASLISVGFAMFSQALTIKAIADINPLANTFNVALSKSDSAIVQGNVTPITSYTEDYFNNKMVEGSTAIIATRGEVSTISNLGATFTELGQSVTYTFYAYNAGEYAAYLNSVVFNNVEDENSFKVCEAISGTTEAQATAGCNNISVSISIGGTVYNSSNENVNNHLLAIGNSDTIIITISYSGSSEADGDFYVRYGDIALTYSSVD